MTEVALVSMPFASPQRPSIALGILKRALATAGIGASIDHADLWWAEVASLESLSLIGHFHVECLMAEWIFASAAFPDFQPDANAFYELIGRKGDQSFVSTVNELRGLSPDFIDMAARRVLARRPKIVGCSSMFQQHTASIGLLRRLRELDDSVITVIGGANCEGSMGGVAHRRFSWIDFIVNGEAEDVFPTLCREILDQGRDVKTTLPGVYAPWHRTQAPDKAPIRLVIDRIDTSPEPDYDDYFSTLKELSINNHIAPGLLVETSRGCWWGQKHHCTFCGLNGNGMNYRSKSGDRVLEQFDHLSERYQLSNFGVVDNIIDMEHLKSILPQIADSPREFNLFYETKANLRRDQVAALAAAGARWIQPGIESLHDDILRIMDKGTSALINVQLLKWAREYGVRLSWNLLMGFPGEKPEWYDEMTAWLPLLSHLQPPAGLGVIRYDRFSPYHNTPEKYGLALSPSPSYAYIYPLDADDLADIAYFFEDRPSGVRRRDRSAVSPEHDRFRQATREWAQLHRRKLPPILSMADNGTRISIIDTRPVALNRRVTLDGLARDVYLACDTARSLGNLSTGLPDADGLQDVLDELVARRLTLCNKGRYLSLAVQGELPAFPERYPGGDILEIPPQVGTCRSRLQHMAITSGIAIEAAQ
jgi:ribosomal peptide maturation radical SAM protein 1